MLLQKTILPLPLPIRIPAVDKLHIPAPLQMVKNSVFFSRKTLTFFRIRV